MKGAFTIFQAVLIFAIAVSLAAVAAPWAYKSVQKSLDVSEMKTIKDQMQLCNDKLVETARTGTSNKCTFSANRGKITAKIDGIYYNLASTADICDTHDWYNVNKDTHLESKCLVTQELRDYNMRWRWPKDVMMEGLGFTGEISKSGTPTDTITFEPEVSFITITVVVEFDYIEGQGGKEIEISRIALTEDKAKLNVVIR